jgi:hypothetical protein
MSTNAFPKSLCLLCFFAVLLIGTQSAKAQETRNEFWPEINLYINVKPKVRLYLLGTINKSIEDGEIRNAQSYEAQLGAHVDYIPTHHVILRAGYRYGSAVGDNDDGFREHRLITEQTLRKLLPGDFLLSDRNREDFRFVNGDFSFRYRNRVTVEREVHFFKGRNITPYVSGEIFYDTRYNVWNRNRMAVGVQHTVLRGPLRKMALHKRQVVMDIYFLKQNDSRSQSPHVRAIGAALVFYF